VERDKLEDHRRPSEFKELLVFRFWVQDREGGPPRTLGFPEPNPDDYRYYDSLNELSSELAKELQAQKKVAIDPGPPPPASGPMVFLAEATDDLDLARDETRRYLHQAGVRVLPDTCYSREPNAFKNALEVDLQKSDLFVQLLSATPGKKAPDLPRGYAYLQLECAKKAGKKIMQWHSRELELSKVQDEDQLALLQGDSVMAVGIEEFKREVVKHAFSKPKQSEPRTIQTFVFVNMDTRDRSLAEDVCNALDKFGAEYSLPLQEGTSAEVRGDLERNLLECNGLIIIYGKATAGWVRKQLLQCRKIIYKRKSTLKAIAVYEGPPEPKVPLDLKLQNMHILDGRKFLNEKNLESFIDHLRQEEDI
jgi:hypothetical protein